MNKIGYEERLRVYTNALVQYGTNAQLVVAIEELSECQKEICKIIRGKGSMENLAEEIADASIMLEQMQYFFGIDDQVSEVMDEKIKRLDQDLNGKKWGVGDDAKAVGKRVRV